MPARCLTKSKPTTHIIASFENYLFIVISTIAIFVPSLILLTYATVVSRDMLQLWIISNVAPVSRLMVDGAALHLEKGSLYSMVI